MLLCKSEATRERRNITLTLHMLCGSTLSSCQLAPIAPAYLHWQCTVVWPKEHILFCVKSIIPYHVDQQISSVAAELLHWTHLQVCMEPVTDKHLGAQPMQFKEGQRGINYEKIFMVSYRHPANMRVCIKQQKKPKVSRGRGNVPLSRFQQKKVKHCYFPLLCVSKNLFLPQCRDPETQTLLIKTAIKLVCYDKHFITFFLPFSSRGIWTSGLE